MIAFTSFPTLHRDQDVGATKHHPGVEADMIDDLDLDDGDFADGSVKLTSPGETLTSVHAFMR
jgi:hypothetical protein